MAASGSASVLVVDDASFMRVVLKETLVSNQLASKIYEAGDAVGAVQAYKQYKPDVVTMDINMPGADGIQALKAIMKMDPKAKVVMITSAEKKNIVQDAMRAGARDYVVKPFEKTNVAMVLNKVLRAR
jgi:two-component system chemotaxis response regulator CheY